MLICPNSFMISSFNVIFHLMPSSETIAFSKSVNCCGKKTPNAKTITNSAIIGIFMP